MEFKVTRKDIVNSHISVFSVGYGYLQHLLRYQDRQGYNAGVNGWNYDVYTVGNYAIVTGYRPFGKHIPYDILRKYENKAKEINGNRSLEFKAKRNEVNKLLHDFIAEAKNL